MADDTWDGVLRVRRGKTHQTVFVLETAPGVPFSLDGYQVRMQCRPDSDSDALLLDVDSADGPAPASIEREPDPALWPDSAGDTTGWIVLTLGATVTGALPGGGPFEIEPYNPDDPDDVPDVGLTGLVEVEAGFAE